MGKQGGVFLSRCIISAAVLASGSLVACAEGGSGPGDTTTGGTGAGAGAGAGTGIGAGAGTGTGSGAGSGTGSGSSTGSGGSGGGGSTAACVQAPASLLNFDAYDGENLSFLVAGEAASGVYMGPWELTDELDATTPDPVRTYELTMGTGYLDTGYSLTIADEEAKLWGGGVGFWMSACVDAATYTGISFRVKGATPTGFARLAVGTRDTTPPSAEGSGACAGTDCADAGSEFPLDVDPEAWKLVELPWTAFTGGVGSGGVAAPLSGFGIAAFTFTVGLQYDAEGALPGPYELTIDEIGFY